MAQAWPGFPRSCPPCWLQGAWGMHGMQGQAGGQLLSSPRWNQWPGMLFSRNSCRLGPELGVGCSSTLCSKDLHCSDVSKRRYHLSAPWHGDRGDFCSASLKGLSSHHCDTRELSGLIACPNLSLRKKSFVMSPFPVAEIADKDVGWISSTWVCFSALFYVWGNLSSKF